MPGTVLRDSHIFFHLILKQFYEESTIFSHFPDEETEALRA